MAKKPEIRNATSLNSAVSTAAQKTTIQLEHTLSFTHTSRGIYNTMGVQVGLW